jgi:very-short-patch-repair endonuclease
MNRKYNEQYISYRSDLRDRARYLRNNSTKAEILLWLEIKNRKLGVQWHRQVPIGNFIVDFYCHELKMAIELDGTSHLEKGVPNYDKFRQKKLEAAGVTVIRFDDDQVLYDREDVVRSIGEVADYLEMRNL